MGVLVSNKGLMMETQIKDVNGNEIKLGSYVVYPGRHELKFARITEARFRLIQDRLWNAETGKYESQAPRPYGTLRATGAKKGYRGIRKTRFSLRESARLLVVDETSVPAEQLAILNG